MDELERPGGPRRPWRQADLRPGFALSVAGAGWLAGQMEGPSAWEPRVVAGDVATLAGLSRSAL